jgi:hypothetical protein
MDDSDRELLAKAVKTLQEKKSGGSLGLVLTGRIQNGKLVLDQKTQDEITRKFAQADVAFIAMNSPFDTHSQSV